MREVLFSVAASPDNASSRAALSTASGGITWESAWCIRSTIFSLANPPSNEKLLSLLAKEFADHKYDIRHIERLVLIAVLLSAQLEVE